MRVLLTLASSSVTGPAERMLGDAQALRAAGHEVAVAFDTVSAGTLRAACEARGLPIAAEIALSRHVNALQVLADVRALRERLKQVDLVHTHFSHDHHLALVASAGLPVRLVRSLESEHTGSGFALARTDGVEVPFRQLADSPRLASLRARGRVAVLPSAVDSERFAPGAGGRLRDSLGLGADVPLIGIVARLKPERRHAELISAFQSVAAKTSAHLVLVGRGEGQGALEVQVRGLGLADRVHFAGYWSGDALVDAYRGLDVAVWLAPGNDGGARGVLEAMAVGRPVVAYQSPPMDEQLGDGAGVLVPEADVAALAAALQRLVERPHERDAVGRAARSRVVDRYTPARRSAELLRFYAAILRT